jgi:hypothetical protein
VCKDILQFVDACCCNARWLALCLSSSSSESCSCQLSQDAVNGALCALSCSDIGRQVNAASSYYSCAALLLWLSVAAAAHMCLA